MWHGLFWCLYHQQQKRRGLEQDWCHWYVQFFLRSFPQNQKIAALLLHAHALRQMGVKIIGYIDVWIQSENLMRISSSGARRLKMAESVVAVAHKLQLDGFYLRWMWPGCPMASNFIIMGNIWNFTYWKIDQVKLMKKTLFNRRMCASLSIVTNSSRWNSFLPLARPWKALTGFLCSKLHLLLWLSTLASWKRLYRIIQ